MHMSPKNTLKALFCACAVLASQEAAAKWYTASGTAPILDSVSQARDEAVNDAIRNAMLEAGAQVSIVTDFKGGVLQHSNTSVQSSVPVRRVLVTEEQKTAGRVNVTVKVLLDDAHQRTCAASSLRKSVVPVAFAYRDQNAYQGSAGIENINSEISNAVYSALSKSPALAVRPPVNATLQGTGYGSSPGGALRDELVGLGRQNQAGFIVTGTIDSTATSDAGSGVLDKLFYQRTRTISFSVSVYDARNGSQLFTQNYQAVTDWPFKQGEFVDLRSEQFKGSAYGARIHQLTERAASDIIAALQCRTPSASIIDIENDGFIIDLGTENGIRPGMKFTIGQTSETVAPDGGTFSRVDRARGVYIVEKAYPTSARLKPANLDDNLLNIRVNDQVQLAE
jgi:hypothetical protein